MKRQALLAAIAIAALATSGASAFAAEGLTESVWHGIPEYDFTPNAADITSEQVWAAANAPAYTFINTVDGFNYSNSNFGGGAPTVAAWFGSDAAGAAQNDTTNPYNGFFAFDASGYIYAPVAGSYTFSLGDTYNQIDDAARVTVDGVVVAEQNFAAGLSDYSDTLALSAGYHSFDLFYFQTQYGYGLGLTAAGPNGAIHYTTTAVPEPTTWAMLTLGFAGLGFAGWRHGRGARAVVA